MDRLLRDIQSELVPDREPEPLLAAPDEPVSPPAAPAAAPVAGPAADTTPPPTPDPHLQALTELSARLLASMRELLAGYERMLVPSASRQPGRRAESPRVRARPDDPSVTVSAAPFATTEALREFEAAVARLPGVREVAVQGYEGTDRAIIAVRLDQPNP